MIMGYVDDERLKFVVEHLKSAKEEMFYTLNIPFTDEAEREFQAVPRINELCCCLCELDVLLKKFTDLEQFYKEKTNEN